MKFGFLLLIIMLSLMLGTGFAQAGDVSCQVDLLKPKINASVIEEEANKPAKLTVAEARLKLKKSRFEHARIENEAEQQTLNDQESEEDSEQTPKANSEKVTAKKTSRLGGIFDILLPSRLRNPVK